MSDRREMNQQWWSKFDARAMQLHVRVEPMDGDPEPDEDDDDGSGATVLRVAAKFEVCETCHGKGTHVNPSIDSHGLSREDFDDDPDFAEDYMRGMYDVRCNECHGERVVPVLDESRIDAATLARVNEMIDDYFEYQSICAAERRMGC